METAWEQVASKWDPVAVLGVEGDQFANSHAIQTSNHELTVAMTLIAAMAPLVNGAIVRAFP
eukprot:2730933-Lingulodinium_polyedra.AAC.1